MSKSGRVAQVLSGHVPLTNRRGDKIQWICLCGAPYTWLTDTPFEKPVFCRHCSRSYELFDPESGNE